MNTKKNKNYHCELLPYERTDCLSIQDVNQKLGWNITAFDLSEAWELTKGEGVIIAVLDTGCDLNHEDLKNNLLPGKNFVNPKKPPKDKNGHGTHAIGTLVAEDNNIGVVGVCPRAKVIPIKVLDDNGNGNLLNVAKGIRWAVEQGADIISMSLGSPMRVQSVRKAIQYAASQGVPTFVAAGNSGYTKEVFYPANYPETIAIGAVDRKMRRANFSNTGKNLDFMAPGVDILSTVPTNWYATLSGTSMACPFAVGVAALVLSYARNTEGHEEPKTVEDYRAEFREHTIPTTDPNYAENKFYEGFGIIDPRKWIKAKSK